MMAELSHLEEIINQLDKHTADPFSLPSSTEQMIAELKGSNDQTHHWALQTPPSSPSSLGSRKSSMCRLGSIHSSSSGSVASALPPGQQQLSSTLGGPNSHLVQQLQLQQQQHMRHRSLSQVAGVNVVRLSSVSSQDSGFTSQDTLVLRPTSSPPSNQLAQEVRPFHHQCLPFLSFIFEPFLERRLHRAIRARRATAIRAHLALLIHLEWAPLGPIFKYFFFPFIFLKDFII